MILRAVRIRRLDAPIANDAAARLGADDRQRLDRFAQLADRWRFLTGRRLTRRMLNQTLGPGNWTQARSDRERPEVRASAAVGVDINIAHAADMVVGALVENGRVGIDVEPIGALHDFADIAPTFLNEAELARLEGLRPELRQQAATRYWVLKEAVLKCDGVGFGADPRTIPIDPAAAEGEWRWSPELEMHYAWRSLAGNALIGLAFDPASARAITRRTDSFRN